MKDAPKEAMTVNTKAHATSAKYDALHLMGNRYAVRPLNALGTCGWINGAAWQVKYVTARNAEDALRKYR
jgi:hypothetical protein